MMKGVLAPVILVALLLAGWEAACRLLDLPVYFLPPPTAVARAIVEGAPLLLSSAWNTCSMALTALAVASAIACLLSLGAGLNRSIEQALRPLAVAMQVTPVVALAPLFEIWAGVDHPRLAVVGLTVVVAFFPIYSGAGSGLRSPHPDLERLFDLYRAPPPPRLAQNPITSPLPGFPQ